MYFSIKRLSYKGILFLLLALLAIIFAASLVIGSEKVAITQIIKALQEQNYSAFHLKILFTLRLPRSILALVSGALLAGAGTVFQGFFRNSLADPGLIGVSSGATLGAVLFSIFALFIPLGAFLGAIGAVLLVYIIAGGKKTSFEPSRLLLAGTALGVFFSAVTSIIILMKDKELYKMYLWTQGSFNGKGWQFVRIILLPSILSILLMVLTVKPLDILSSGEKTAQSLGLPLQKVRVLCLIAGSLASATAVCAGGTIGFIGLIAPHIMRILFGSTHKKLLPLSMVFGSILLLLADIFSRTITAPMELPIGIVTAILGVPFFLHILLHAKKGIGR